ncbi:tetratricopeptide repeat protein [Fulvivirgaceae bacterium PWU4]|uniref:Tetratricopeptide repeat protein n=1 Tax=Chryseosolibacter histidini TaxID=2782349 RepID=A0AAP2DMF2_9BACT|nr:tetratricopeptide repeat protein [Chryseosolibacter histidini]MBT1699030.1 tetratricopeptide repeat protein [Chryseosolibacter histidini]
MKTSLCSLLLLCAGITGYAQKTDSLERVLLNTTADTTRTILLSLLADQLTVSDPARSLEKARQGLALARRIGFAKGIFENHYSLASSFRGQALFDSAVLHFHRAYTVALSRNDLRAQADACSSLGHCFMRKSEHDSARHYLDKGLALAKKAGDFKIEAGIYNNYGNILLEESNYQKALDYFVQAARLYEHPLNDDYGQCLALSNIGNIQYRLGHYDQALDYAGQSMAIARRRSFKPSIGYAHKLLGRIYRKQGKFDAALEEYRQAQKLFITMNDRRSESEVLQNIGNIYFDKEQHRDALVNYLESLRLAKSTSSKPLIAGDYSCIGQAYLVLKKYDAALRYLDSSRVAASVMGNGYLLMDNYGAMSEVYEAKGDYKKALAMHHRYAEIKDSITQSENRALAEETQAKYELEKKEAQIALLEKDQALTSLALEAHRTVQAGAVIAAFLVIIIAALLVNRYRISNEVKRLAEIERMRNAIARDLHDDIGSTLSTINIISQLAMREETRSSAYLGRIAEQSSQMMENMTDMVWSINPGNDSLAKVVVKMKVFTGEILEPRNIRYRFVGEESLNGVVLDADKRKNLFLIFKEAINNAAKYSGASEVEITLKQSDKKTLMLQIADNGNGFDTEQVRHGNGLHNMEVRAKALGAQFTLTSAVSQGTRISLDMPIT